MINRKLTIAIDGYSSCGKSTVARSLARRMGYTYIDSGAMYRAVTLFCIRKGLIKDSVVDEEKLRPLMSQISIDFEHNPITNNEDTFMNGENIEHEIRRIEVSNLVSPVSKIDFVREEMVKLQRQLSKDKGIVMDGRDIGTVVFPDADLKIFMTADPEIRAMRRYEELRGKNETVSLEEIKKNIQNRDYIDSHREHSPLRQADDAVVLDNSMLTREEQLQWILDLIKLRFQS